MDAEKNVFFFLDQNFVDLICFFRQFFKKMVGEDIEFLSPGIYLGPAILVFFSQQSALLLEVLVNSDNIIQIGDGIEQIVSMNFFFLNFQLELSDFPLMLNLSFLVVLFKNRELFSQPFDFIKIHL